MDRGTRAAGFVPTPPPLAARLMGSLGAPPEARLLDPACGDGELLLAALEKIEDRASFVRERCFGLELDPARAGVARQRLARAAGVDPAEVRGIHVADALSEDTAWPAHTFVLANPPWVSHSGRGAVTRTTEREDKTGWPASHAEFLERIALHVGAYETGAAILLPSAVAELERYAPCRERVGVAAHPSGPPLELGEAAFPGVVEPAMLLVLAPGPGKETPGAPWLARSPLARALDEALEDFPRAPRSTFADPGVHTGNCAAELLLDPENGQGAPLRQGRDLKPFDLGPASLRLRVDLTRSPGRRFRIPPLERMREFPVLLRQTADRPTAAVHENPGFFRNSLLAARAIPGLAPEALVAILNSSTIAAWHRSHHLDARQRSFPQVKVRHLREVPLPLASRADDPRTHDRLVELARSASTEGVDDLVADAFGLSSDLTEQFSYRTGSSPAAS